MSNEENKDNILNVSSEKALPTAAPGKNIEKIELQGEVIKRKKKSGFKDIFVKGEFKSASSYVIREVFVPAVKNIVVDVVTEGIKSIVYGNGQRRPSSDPRDQRITYNRPVDRRPMNDRQSISRRNDRYSTDDVILSSSAEAEHVLERMGDIIDKFDFVSFADLQALLGFPSTPTDNKWGWYRLNNANVRRIREGWLLELPPIQPER